MLTRQKSNRSRTKRTRRKQSKFITPDLVLVDGKLMRFVANQDSPLSEAERLRGTEMEDGNDAEVGQFLQLAYFVALQFRRRPGEFERLQAHSFWKETGQKPKDPSTSKWLIYFITQARTRKARDLADKKAVILDGLRQDKVEDSAVAARIEELGGIGAAYEAMQTRANSTPQYENDQDTMQMKPTAKGKSVLKTQSARAGTVEDQAGGAEGFRPPYPRCRTRGTEAPSRHDDGLSWFEIRPAPGLGSAWAGERRA
jgi:hypothetical protein